MDTQGVARRRGAVRAGARAPRRRVGSPGPWPGATRRGPFGRRAQPVDPAEPAPVSVSRATVIDARPLADELAADAWFGALEPAALARTGLAVLNRLIGAYRIAAADPYAHQLNEDAAVAVRAGFGEGRAVAEGGWTRAVELARGGAGRGRRTRAARRPQERLAALLAARDHPLACEELTLRARLDLELDLPLAAALGTRLALEATLVELGANARAGSLEDRLTELRELRDDVIAAANSTFVGPLAEVHRQSVAHALERIEATLRAHAARRVLP